MYLIKITKKCSVSLQVFIQKNLLSIQILLFFICFLTINGCRTSKTEVTPKPHHAYGHINMTPQEYASVPAAPHIEGGTVPSTFALDVPSVPFDQGPIGSCVSCATAGEKSILDHLQYNTPYINGGIIYSPSFIYDQVKSSPTDCSVGSTCVANFNLVISSGDCTLQQMPYDETTCSIMPTATQFSEASSHKIAQYLAIDPLDVNTIKQYIYAGTPVIIAFQVDEGFEELGPTSIWSSFGSTSLGSHCTLLYGWDDNRNAFKMLNSWGSNWADNGSTWIDYNFLVNGTSPTYGKIFSEAFILQNATTQNNGPSAAFDVNGASTTLSQNQSITFYDRSLNNPTSWQWTFQGGNPSSSTEQNPTVTYASAGTYAVTLTVANQYGSNTKSVSGYITVSGPSPQKPVAQFAVNGSTTVNTGAPVSFINQSTNNPTSFSWSFPGANPSSSTLTNPTVTYPNPGSYSVSLTATNQYGNNSQTIANYINVTGVSTQGPVAKFTVSGNTTINTGGSISFVNQSTNNPTSYSWSFPGGLPSSSNLANPTITYNNAGQYSVNLTVSNQYGTSTASASDYVTVNNSSQNWTCGQPFTDPRDGQVYQTVQINGQCWLAENLRYTNNNSVGIYYGNNPSNYTTYGCLYTYADVVNGNLAPPGWHIPSNDEIVALGQYILQNYNNNGGVLKSTSTLWAPPNYGATNATGFNALPGGYNFQGAFSGLGNVFYMWTSTAQSGGGDAAILQSSSNGLGGGFFNGGYYMAIRCVKN
jgi:uncharacterized protein (TIGR02145 family)